MTVTTLDDIDRSTVSDLTQRLGVSLATAPPDAQSQVYAAGPSVELKADPADSESAQVAAAEIDAYEAIARGRPMQARGQQNEPAGLPHRPTDLAASVLQHLHDVQARNRELADQLAEVMEAHRRDAMELVAADMREMATKEELEQALSIIAELKRELTRSRSPWWKKRRQ